VVAIRESNQVALSWRYLASDAMNTQFNVYRDGKKIGSTGSRQGTFFVDKNKKAAAGAQYEVRPVVNGKEQKALGGSYALPADAPLGYLNIPLDRPADGVTPAGDRYTYHANDASIGDVDGDGNYEIILKWDPSNSHDNAHDGYTGNVFVDCYRLSGERLWRIDLGRNVRAGAHYTQFMVYDLDGDGRAEVVMKTSDGTVDGTGKVIGRQPERSGPALQSAYQPGPYPHGQ
jgi:rhamnogalacturonan endolyase